MGRPVVPDVYASRYGASESTSTAGSEPGCRVTSSGHSRASRSHSITCSTACGPASSSAARISIRLPRRSDQSEQITTFACESSSRAAIAGAAKPEKIGTCTAPTCAHACEAIATAGHIGM